MRQDDGRLGTGLGDRPGPGPVPPPARCGNWGNPLRGSATAESPAQSPRRTRAPCSRGRPAGASSEPAARSQPRGSQGQNPRAPRLDRTGPRRASVSPTLGAAPPPSRASAIRSSGQRPLHGESPEAADATRASPARRTPYLPARTPPSPGRLQTRRFRRLQNKSAARRKSRLLRRGARRDGRCGLPGLERRTARCCPRAAALGAASARSGGARVDAGPQGRGQTGTGTRPPGHDPEDRPLLAVTFGHRWTSLCLFHPLLTDMLGFG